MSLAPVPHPGRLHRWLAERLSHRLALMAGVLTVTVLVVGLLLSLALSLRISREHLNTEVALRADNAARRVVAALDEIERGVHGIASSTFTVRTLAMPNRPDDALLPYLLENRVVTRYGVQLRLCDRNARTITRVLPGKPGDSGHLDSTSLPCADILDFQGRMHDRRTALLAGEDGQGHHSLQLQVPVRSSQGMLGMVIADIDPVLALSSLMADSPIPVALTGPRGDLAGHHVDGRYVAVDAKLDLPAGSDFAPLGLGVRVGIEPQFTDLRWGALALAYLFAALLLGAAAFAIARRLTDRLFQPVAALERATERAAAGEPVELDPMLQSDDEVGHLAAGIKTMADSLQRSNAALATQVEELVAARNAAQQASIAKTQFLATMSHEIRTPMNAILGLSYLALQSPMDEKTRGYVEKTHTAAENLLGILNGILDFSKVEAGRLTLENESFVVRQVIDRVVGTASVKAHAKGLEVLVEVDDAVPLELTGDALRLGQVLLNLCDNAIKFTAQGRIEVSVQVMLMLGKEVELLFCVGDTGAGIPAAKQKDIFELFTQADASTTRQHGGTGLGLAISKKIVELMGGTIGVSSQVGVGSTFSFTARFGAVAPCAASNDAPAATAARASTLEHRYAALNGVTVLVAEDNELNQLVIRELLERVGANALVVSNGREALELLREHADEVDLVLMDCQMPVMDGFATTRAIRADRHLQRVPILAMTANVLPEDLASCRGAGMNDHLSKPIDVEELYSVIQQWLQRGGDRHSHPAPLDASH